MMNFQYRNGELHCEGVPLSAIAREAGTPTYVYSLDEIERRARAYLNAFPGALIAYAYKANANLAILRHLVALGVGADVVSGGELWRALKGGTPPQKIVFNGNGKTPAEIGYALDSGVLCINVDSAEELELVSDLARARGIVAPVAFRVNPDIDAQTHHHITTGLKESKFGVPIGEAGALYESARRLETVCIVGIHCHIGSQITRPGPMLEAAQSIKRFALDLQRDGIALPLINLGGGLGIPYHDENPMAPQEWATAVREAFGTETALQGSRLVLEPGRSMVGPAGALLATTVHVKRTSAKTFVVVDAGMNDLLRPALYGAWHEVRAARDGLPALTADVVGPICESSDVLAKDRELPAIRRGDLIAVMDAGAYGFAMASRYNQQPLPAEVVVQGERWQVSTRRETYEQMAERESS
ncbi:MAG: diaminopimelate decarboxylase [Chloroflexi bacterium]|nr:diaminopimelate decarboxylase [Chloroflexota bacterium]